MSITAFNSAAFPRLSPWDCFSTEWFGVLVNDARMMGGFKNSLIIGISVVFVSVPMGLAGALMLGQLSNRVRPVFYTVTISTILVPGVVLGISTLIFWDRMGMMFNAGYDSIFYDGIVLTIIGQSTFISAYTMLVFISRLQRFDPVLEEAALDLGATNIQTFRKILLPFLKPAIGSAAVLAFLASFENYNTTVFTIVSESTLTTVLASKVRYGINPSISALAVIIIGLTITAALIHEVLKRREQAREIALKKEGQVGNVKTLSRTAFRKPVTLMVLLIFVAGLSTVWMARAYDVNQCKIEVSEEKRKKQEELSKKRLLEMQKRLESQEAASANGSDSKSSKTAPGTDQYGSIFAPTNLEGQVESTEDQKENSKTPKNQYQNIFAPTNLEGQVESIEEKTEASKTPKNQYQNIFAPVNLEGQVKSEKE
ncbi:MAG: ABC transporter permease [SAR324 cluster bacterium]|nr:ABC transporter permease [SAR324 cluster bacterium]MBL7035356.1 ABC transporter permease [SAR324 cluster bacterium]